MLLFFIFISFIISIFTQYGSLSNRMSSYDKFPVDMKSRVMHNIRGRKANTPRTTNISIAISDTRKTIIPNYLTTSLYSSEFVNVTQYLLNRNRKKTFVFKPKRCAGVANNLRSIRGMMMISMAHTKKKQMLNAVQCTHKVIVGKVVNYEIY